MKSSITRSVAFSFACVILLAGFSTNSDAAAGTFSDRAKKWQFAFGPHYTNSTSVDFDGGASADIDSDWGGYLGFGYNFDEKLALDFDISWGSASYTGTRVLQNNTKETISGRLDTSSTRFNLLYYFMDKALTPFVAGNIGWTWIDSNIAAGPPVTGCWWDPWWGWVCSGVQPTYGSTEFSYGVSLGFRYDVNQSFFMRGSVGNNWVDISNTSSTPDVTFYRYDFGFMF